MRLGVELAPFWPVIFTVAFLLAPQRLSLLWSRPFLPPARFRMNFETGASGTVSKVARRPSLTLSILRRRFDVDLALQVEREVGQACCEERR